MAIDKNKITEAATKYVQRGQYDKAIKEYNKLLELDPRDARTQQKLGELYQKKGDTQLAASCFLKVAESYAADGFFLKAVAVYKQVLRLTPGVVDINLRLAELHQQLGLIGDAMAQYQLVVAHYEKMGDTRASLDTLHRMVELDPDNVASRVKLAELYAREGMNPEAVSEFQNAADYLKRNNRLDDYLRVAERLAFLNPGDIALARELAGLYLSRQDAKRALAKLQVCFKASPKDPDTLRMLAQAFADMGQVSKTVSVLKELVRVHEERGQVAEEREVWRRILELAPEDPDALAHSAAEAAAWVGPAAPTARTTGTMPAVSQPTPVRVAASGPVTASSPSRVRAAGADAVPKLLTETDVYVKYGLHEKALEHLQKVFALEPDSIEAHEKSVVLYAAIGNHGAAADALVRVIHLCLDRGELERARGHVYALNETAPDCPELPELFARCGANAAPVEELTEVEAAIVDEDGPLEEEGIETATIVDPAADLPDEPFFGAGEGDDEQLFDSDSGSGLQTPAYSARPAAPAPQPVPPAEPMEIEAGAMNEDDSLALSAVADPADDLVEEDEDAEPGDAPLPHATTLEIVSISADLDEDSVPAEHAPADSETSFEGVLDAGSDALALADAGGEFVHAEVDEGHGGAHADAAEAVVASAPEAGDLGSAEDGPVLRSPGVAAPLSRPGFSPDEVAETNDHTMTITPAAGFPAPDAAAEGVDAAQVGAADELDEAEFFIDQNVFDEAREILETVLLAYPDSPRAHALMDRLQAREDAARAGLSDGEFDLAAELAAEGLGEAPSAAVDDFQYSVEDVFNEFKKGVQQIVKPEDVDTHFDLGIAYKEMGLLDDALGEFEQALGASQGRPREVECLTMLGLIHAEREQHAEAIACFRRGLAAPAVSAEAAKALRFELGVALERAGEHALALGHLLEVERLDSRYRDVAAAVARLRARGVSAAPDAAAPAAAAAAPASAPGEPAPARPESTPGKRTRNIGYV